MTLALATARALLKIRVQFREISIKYSALRQEDGLPVRLELQRVRLEARLRERRGGARAEAVGVAAAVVVPHVPGHFGVVAADRPDRASRSASSLSRFSLVGFVSVVGRCALEARA